MQPLNQPHWRSVVLTIVIWVFITTTGCRQRLTQIPPTNTPRIESATVLPTQVLNAAPTQTNPPYPPAPIKATLTQSTRSTLTALPTQTITPTPGANIGIWRCWDDGSPDPCHRGFSGISMLAPDDGWIVGSHGLIMHWDGSEWRAVENQIHINLEQVVPISAADVWAISHYIIDPPNTRSRMLHWDGNTWSEFINPVPIDGHIEAVSFSDHENGWAIVHKSGPQTLSFLYRWDGHAWTMFEQTAVLWDIEMITADSGWAVGSENTILSWTGEAWERQDSPLTLDFEIRSLAVVSESDIWAAAGDNLLHWDGIAWERVPMEFNVQQVSMASGSDGWLVYPGWDFELDTFQQIVRHWNGDSWEAIPGVQIPLRQPENTIKIATTPSGQAWAILDGGDLWHWDGISWKPYYLRERPIATAFEFATPQTAWIAGPDGYIAYWDGVKIQEVKGITHADLTDIAVINERNVWIVGNGAEILHWDGALWRRVGSPSHDDNFNSISFIMPDNGWILGSYNNEGGGSLLYHWDGASWSLSAAEAIPIYQDGGLTSAEFLDESYGWATGGHADTLWKWDGNIWARVRNPANYWLYDVDIIERDDAWAVGIQSGSEMNGIALHWNGSSWQTSLTSIAQFYSIAFRSNSDGWLGASDVAYHWDGSKWSEASIPTYRFEDIVISPDGKYWALAPDGVLLTLDETWIP